MRKHLLRALAVATGASMLLTACANTSSSTDAKTADSVIVRAANGEVHIAVPPKRVVSLSPTATEMLFAIDAGKQVVAADDQSTYPKNAPRTKLSGLSPSADSIAQYQPDLVVVDADRNGVVSALNKLHVPVLVEPAATNLDESYDQIADLGTATGHPKQASQLASKLKQQLATAVGNVKEKLGKRSYYHEVDNTYYSLTSKTFLGSIYSMFGLSNIADAAAVGNNDYPQLNSEYIVKANPDLIFLADGACCGQTKATVAKRPGWGEMNAVRRDRVTELDADSASRWGPRVVEFAQTVAAALSKLDAATP